MTDDPKTTRLWQEIAAEAAREKDPKKLIALTNELEVALDERDKALRAKRAEPEEGTLASSPPGESPGSVPRAS